MSEEEVESEMLRSGLTARPLAAEALARIRAATEQEWRTQIRPQRVRKGWSRIAIAASVVIVAATGLMVTLTDVDTTSPALGRLARVGMQGAEERNWLNRSVALSSGDLLRAGETVHVRSDALVTLANGGTLRMVAGTHINVLSDTRIRLTKGVAYLDIPPGTEGVQFVVQTPVGEVAHVGTQFEVAVLDDRDRERLRVRVREGQIALRGTNGRTALAEAGTELFVQSNGAVRRQPFATAGRDWAWVESMAPEFEIENRLLGDYLKWVARETGRNLTLDAGAQKRVASTRLHGSVHGLTVLDSLAAVMETSALHFDTPDGLIRVSSAREVPLAEMAK